MNNKRLEAYYKAQQIIPDSEWDLFLDTLRQPLPTTFRITGSRQCVNFVNVQYIYCINTMQIGKRAQSHNKRHISFLSEGRSGRGAAANPDTMVNTIVVVDFVDFPFPS
jgi:hypothetical protein